MEYGRPFADRQPVVAALTANASVPQPLEGMEKKGKIRLLHGHFHP